MTPNHLQDKAFLLLLIAVTIAFGAILWQFHGAVFWGVILAILFAPLHRKLLKRMPKRPTLAALCTLGLCLVIVILPMTAITVSLVQEASVIYERVRSGQLNFGLYLQQVIAALPAWAANLLDRLNLTSVGELQQKLSSVAIQASQFVATQALSIGQNTLEFLVGFGIMLYLLFFLLRDGASLARRIGHATPLDDAHKRQLVSKFTTVIRATVKGNIVVAASQGALGGLIFSALGRIPARGEVVQALAGFEFHILDADPRRIKRVRVARKRAGVGTEDRTTSLVGVAIDVVHLRTQRVSSEFALEVGIALPLGQRVGGRLVVE